MSENKPLPEYLPPMGSSQSDTPPGILLPKNPLSLRVKLFSAITLTTGIAVLILGFFSYARARQTQTYLQEQLQVNIVKQAEFQLQNTAIIAANQTDQFLNSITNDLLTEASYFNNIQKQPDLFSTGTYWDARNKLVRLSSGQWDNPNTDIGSILVPSNVTLDDEEIEEINSFMYLDFFAPELLQKKSAIVATYFIDTDGVTIYYPNNDLANIMGDFNATSRATYQDAAQENNPQRLPIWSVAYNDPIKKGLIVTNSVPVYDQNNELLGILCADIQLAEIEKQVANIKIGNTGYAFLIDHEGNWLVLPAQVYIDFDIAPNDLPVGSTLKRTLSGQGPDALRAITQSIITNQNGISKFLLNDVEYYFSFAPISTAGYSLGIVVPSAELNSAYFNIDSELRSQTSQSNNFILIIIIIILAAAGAISWAVGSLLTNPLVALTRIAQQISDGNLTVKAETRPQDEIGTLGAVFNNMTERLRDSFANLEKRVAERTEEIASTNEKYQKQASQLRTIAEITRSAASLKKLDQLLPEITQRISTTFGFYHVGVFLLDTNKEYAVLKAANSEGGQRMLARNHQLKVGQVGIVGFVTQTGHSRIALDVGSDAVFFNNPDLPETHSELTLPLRIGEEIIGALDVQSKEINAFNSLDIDTLGLLADQISIAIENARLFDEMHFTLSEAQNIYTQSALASWREINRQNSAPGFRYSNGSIEPVHSDVLSTSAAAIKETLTIPILFRGQQLGALNIRQPGRTTAWSETEIRLYQSIVERLSFALENARLYNDAQKRAAKERVIGEISAKISSSVNLDNILQIVAEELGRTLPGSEVVIQLEKDSLILNTETGQAL